MTYSAIDGAAAHLTGSYNQILQPIWSGLAVIGQHLGVLDNQIRATIAARLDAVALHIGAAEQAVTDRILMDLGAVAGRMPPQIDMAALAADVARTAPLLPDPSTPMPAMPAPVGTVRTPRLPTVASADVPGFPTAAPVVTGYPEWIDDIGGLLPTAQIPPQYPVVPIVYIPAGGMDSPHSTPDGAAPMPPAPYPPPVDSPYPLLGGGPGGGPLYAAPSPTRPGEPTDYLLGSQPVEGVPPGAAPMPPQIVRQEVFNALASLCASVVAGAGTGAVGGAVDGGASGADSGSAGPDRCPPVEVHIHCAPGVVAAEGIAPAEQFLIGADGDLTDEDRKLMEEALRRRNAERGGPAPQLSPEKRGQAEQFLARQGPAAPQDDPLAAILGWMEEYRKVIAGAADQTDCKDGGKALAGISGIMESIWLWLTGTKDGRGWNVKTGLPKSINELPPIVSGLAEAVAKAVIYLVRQQVNGYEYVTGCTNPGVVPLLLLRGLVGVVEGWGKVPLPEGRDKLNQAVGMACPTGIPSVGEAHTAWLADVIDSDQWRCIVRANGVRDDWAASVRESLRTIPSPLQIVNAWLREGINAPPLADMMRVAGVIRPEHVAWFKSLAEYVPSPSDLVSFMLRDVFDKDVVEKYGYDKDFLEVFGDKAKEWAYAQGMTADQMRYYWRAHWHLPSPTQGYEMLHRLRPGRVPGNVEMRPDDLNELLRVNDYPEFWRGRLTAISYKPLTRVDTRRAYFIGALSEDETREAILDLGYADREADLLLRYWRFERVDWVLRRPFARGYIDGSVSDSELDDELLRLRLTEDQARRIRASLAQSAARESRKRTVGNIRRRVVTGLSAAADAAAELRRFGYSAARAEMMADSWEEERASKGRVITGAQLCRMYASGIITGETYTAGMLRLGYSLLDARRMISLCEVDKKLESSAYGVEGEDAISAAQARERAEKIRAMRLANMAKARAVRAEKGQSASEERALKKLGTVAGYLAKGLGGYPGDYQAALAKMYASLVDGACYSLTGAADLIYAIVVPMAQAKNPQWETLAGEYFRALPPRPCAEKKAPAEQLPPPEMETEQP